MDEYEFFAIDKALNSCEKIDIDVKLRHQADILHLKLKHELAITNFLSEHEVHNNYKDIRKDVQKINQMVEEALEL